MALLLAFLPCRLRTVGFGVRDAAGAVVDGAGHRKGGLLLEAVGTEHELGVFAETCLSRGWHGIEEKARNERLGVW